MGVWGAFIRLTLVSRAFGPGIEAGLGLPLEVVGISTRTAPRRSPPSEVEGARAYPRLVKRSRPSRASRHPPLGIRPTPELAARQGRHQVSSRIPIGAPFTSEVERRGAHAYTRDSSNGADRVGRLVIDRGGSAPLQSWRPARKTPGQQSDLNKCTLRGAPLPIGTRLAQVDRAFEDLVEQQMIAA
jgi:hypothetical protein